MNTPPITQDADLIITIDTPTKQISEALKVPPEIIETVKDAFLRCMNAWDRSAPENKEDETIKPDFLRMLTLAQKEPAGSLIRYKKFRDAA